MAAEVHLASSNSLNVMNLHIHPHTGTAKEQKNLHMGKLDPPLEGHSPDSTWVENGSVGNDGGKHLGPWKTVAPDLSVGGWKQDLPLEETSPQFGRRVAGVVYTGDAWWMQGK